MNAVEVVQEVVSGAAKSEKVANPKEWRYESKGDKDCEVGGSYWQSDACGRGCEMRLRSGTARSAT